MFNITLSLSSKIVDKQLQVKLCRVSGAHPCAPGQVRVNLGAQGDNPDLPNADRAGELDQVQIELVSGGAAHPSRRQLVRKGVKE